MVTTHLREPVHVLNLKLSNDYLIFKKFDILVRFVFINIVTDRKIFFGVLYILNCAFQFAGLNNNSSSYLLNKFELMLIH